MRALILSDIHGNLEALQAVLYAAGPFDQLWNLGDLVGYGASPNEVLDLVRPISTIVVRGNHDRVCCGLTSPNGFNPIARAAAIWTRDQLSHDHLLWLRALPQGPVLPPSSPGDPSPQPPTISCVHGSPIDEDQYILTMRDAWTPLQHSVSPLTFFGHTHVQGGFSQRDLNWHDLRPPFLAGTDPKARPSAPVSLTLALEPETRHLINPGSVGQPRDHDWRAAFAIYDSDRLTITYHRIPYDLGAAQQRILAAHLPDRLAARLREGR